ncbi:hypothetical protein BDA96_04G214700 [Sorghum bicolor]|uniref:Uncharacterized protein n=1 Tax=Sorghum bicolor TaxID=4558 RepID=A0A921R5J4_SORBI|nr:hypothetical protein BDA96_04G214700 [Sorghum bicolor]
MHKVTHTQNEWCTLARGGLGDGAGAKGRGTPAEGWSWSATGSGASEVCGAPTVSGWSDV